MAASVAQGVGTRGRRPPAPFDEPILASKITAPGVPDWAIQRPRISKLIAQGTRWCPLTVVTGPPGAGKTMALALWTAPEAGRVAWVCLDKYDNRPGVFWSNVVAALRRSGVAVPGALPAATGERAADQGFLLRLASVLAVQDPPVTLVLDDLHLLTDPPVLDGLDYVLRNVGPGMRLVVCSRMDPLLPLHRYRLAGELAEDPGQRPRVQHRRSRPADGPAWDHAVSGLARVPRPANRRLGGRHPPGGDLHGRPSPP